MNLIAVSIDYLPLPSLHSILEAPFLLELAGVGIEVLVEAGELVVREVLLGLELIVPLGWLVAEHDETCK